MFVVEPIIGDTNVVAAWEDAPVDGGGSDPAGCVALTPVLAADAG